MSLIILRTDNNRVDWIKREKETNTIKYIDRKYSNYIKNVVRKIRDSKTYIFWRSGSRCINKVIVVRTSSKMREYDKGKRVIFSDHICSIRKREDWYAN